ncbi:hypothetical protein H1C71_018623, partial [Ictidomys tridecemlineatus]
MTSRELGVRMSVVMGRGLKYLNCALPGESGSWIPVPSTESAWKPSRAEAGGQDPIDNCPQPGLLCHGLAPAVWKRCTGKSEFRQRATRGRGPPPRYQKDEEQKNGLWTSVSPGALSVSHKDNFQSLDRVCTPEAFITAPARIQLRGQSKPKDQAQHQHPGAKGAWEAEDRGMATYYCF